MARNINLNSSEWCDMVFEGKNKEYGAYEMRQTSSKRHLIALGAALAFTLVIALIPSFLKAVSSQKDMLGGYDETLTMADIAPLDESKEEIIVEPTAAPPIQEPLRATIQFTPPTIVEASEVTEENQMRSQTELIESEHQIGRSNIEGVDDPTAIDPDEFRTPPTNIVPVQETGPKEFVEVMPEYPGGKAELAKYLSSNLRYPTIAAETGIEGRVIVKFVVGKDGKISNVKVVRPLDPSCDKEAIRVVKSMSAWVPGRQNGNAVAVYFTLPIYFKLNK